MDAREGDGQAERRRVRGARKGEWWVALMMGTWFTGGWVGAWVHGWVPVWTPGLTGVGLRQPGGPHPGPMAPRQQAAGRRTRASAVLPCACRTMLRATRRGGWAGGWALVMGLWPGLRSASGRMGPGPPPCVPQPKPSLPNH